jgi:dolichol-phosphate mannosyltransferase
MRFTGRVKRFLIIGSSAAFVNFLLMILFVEVFWFKTYFLKNLANVSSIEISIFYNFLLSRLWTWVDAPKKQGKSLVVQFLSFNLAALTGMSMRVIVFAILEKWGVFYLLNVAFGIGLVATVDFILYDKLVFRRPANAKKPL